MPPLEACVVDVAAADAVLVVIVPLSLKHAYTGDIFTLQSDFQTRSKADLRSQYLS